MQIKIILNAFQKDFFTQLSECFAFYSQFYTEHTCSLIIFSSSEKENEHINYLSNLNKENIFSTITLIPLSQNSVELQLDALCSYENNRETFSYLFPSNLWGKSLSTRFAYRIKSYSLNSVISLETNISNNTCSVKKFSYSNNCLVEFLLSSPPYCLSLAKESFKSEKILQARENSNKFPHNPTHSDQMHTRDIQSLQSLEFEIFEWNDNSVPQNILSFKEKTESNSLAEAKFVVICGQGMDSKEKVLQIQALAESMKAAFGVTRPVAMNAQASIDKIVGISGNICSADTCIVIGASGAGAFYAGIEKCKTIIAVNTNENAAIIEKADLVVIEDGLLFMEKLAKTIIEDTH